MAKSRRIFRETQHPRDDQGRFAKKGGGRWVSRVVRQHQASFGDTSAAQPGMRGGTVGGGVLDLGAISRGNAGFNRPKAAKRTERSAPGLTEFMAQPTAKTSGGAGTTLRRDSFELGPNSRASSDSKRTPTFMAKAANEMAEKRGETVGKKVTAKDTTPPAGAMERLTDQQLDNGITMHGTDSPKGRKIVAEMRRRDLPVSTDRDRRKLAGGSNTEADAIAATLAELPADLVPDHQTRRQFVSQWRGKWHVEMDGQSQYMATMASKREALQWIVDAQKEREKLAVLKAGDRLDTSRDTRKTGGVTTTTPEPAKRTAYDQLFDPNGPDNATIKNPHARKIVAQMEAHGWKLTGQDNMVSLTNWKADDGREMTVQFLTGVKPIFREGGRFNGRDLSFKAALALAVTPTFEAPDGSSTVTRRLFPELDKSVSGMMFGTGSRDVSVEPLVRAQRSLSGYGNTQQKPVSEVAADLRNVARRNREVADQREAYDRTHALSDGNNPQVVLMRERADQFEKIADEMERSDAAMQAFEVEKQRRANAPLDIRPTARNTPARKATPKQVKTLAADREIGETIARLTRESEAKTAAIRAESLRTMDGRPPTDGRPDGVAAAVSNKGWDLERSKGRAAHMSPDIARSGNGTLDGEEVRAEVMNPKDGVGPYRYRIYRWSDGSTVETGEDMDLNKVFAKADRIFSGQRGSAPARGAGKTVRFEARRIERPKDRSRGDFGKGPFYDYKVMEIDQDGNEREALSTSSLSRAEDAAKQRNDKEATAGTLAERTKVEPDAATVRRANSSRQAAERATQRRVEELRQSRSPKDNGAKVKALESGNMDAVDLYRTAMAGPSGQRAAVLAGRVRHTPDNPSGEFRILDGGGETAGWASRVARNGEIKYATHEEDYDGGVKLLGWADTLSHAADVLTNGEAAASSGGTLDARRISGRLFQRNPSRSKTVEELDREAERREQRMAQEALDRGTLGPEMRRQAEKVVERKPFVPLRDPDPTSREGLALSLRSAPVGGLKAVGDDLAAGEISYAQAADKVSQWVRSLAGRTTSDVNRQALADLEGRLRAAGQADLTPPTAVRAPGSSMDTYLGMKRSTLLAIARMKGINPRGLDNPTLARALANHDAAERGAGKPTATPTADPEGMDDMQRRMLDSIRDDPERHAEVVDRFREMNTAKAAEREREATEVREVADLPVPQASDSPAEQGAKLRAIGEKVAGFGEIGNENSWTDADGAVRYAGAIFPKRGSSGERVLNYDSKQGWSTGNGTSIPAELMPFYVAEYNRLHSKGGGYNPNPLNVLDAARRRQKKAGGAGPKAPLDTPGVTGQSGGMNATTQQQHLTDYERQGVGSVSLDATGNAGLPNTDMPNPPAGIITPADAVTALNNTTTRAMARAILAGLTAAQLREVAGMLREGGITIRSGATKDDIRRAIVEYAVGRLADAMAIERTGGGQR